MICPWEPIADSLHRAGWSYGFSQAEFAFIGPLWVVDAMKDGERYVVQAEMLEEALRELRRVILNVWRGE